MAVLLANVRSTFFINFKQICGNGLGRLSENPPGWMILSFFNFTLADKWFAKNWNLYWGLVSLDVSII